MTQKIWFPTFITLRQKRFLFCPYRLTNLFNNYNKMDVNIIFMTDILKFTSAKYKMILQKIFSSHSIASK
jgi:hypothetical protein